MIITDTGIETNSVELDIPFISRCKSPGAVRPDEGDCWIYLSFQDDNHPFQCISGKLHVGYTFHFKMIITNSAKEQEVSQLDIPFISR